MNKGVNRNALPMLTEMRGILALLVFQMHLGFYLPFLRRLSCGYLAVDFFFVLSGFVLTHVYHAWFYPSFQAGSFRNFFWARFGRVYPLHFLCCTLYFLLTGLLLSRWAISGYVHEILALNALPRWPGNNPVSWSIGSECGAYLIAPLLLRVLTAQKPWRLALAIVLSAATLYWDVFIRNGLHSLNIYTVIRCLPEFTLGICCYEICNRWPPSLRLAASLCGASILALIGALTLVPVEAWRDLMCAGSFCVFIPCAIHLRGPFVRGFHSAFGFLGEISYSVYMVHPVILIGFTGQFLPFMAKTSLSHASVTVVVYAMTTLLVIVMSILSYRYIELPARAFFKRFAQRPRSNTIPTTPAPADVLLTSASNDSSVGR
jgi:peptidoglycan/LPS O-acetylase OafA/YrhL